MAKVKCSEDPITPMQRFGLRKATVSTELGGYRIVDLILDELLTRIEGHLDVGGYYQAAYDFISTHRNDEFKSLSNEQQEWINTIEYGRIAYINKYIREYFRELEGNLRYKIK